MRVGNECEFDSRFLSSSEAALARMSMFSVSFFPSSRGGRVERKWMSSSLEWCESTDDAECSPEPPLAVDEPTVEEPRPVDEPRAVEEPGPVELEPNAVPELSRTGPKDGPADGAVTPGRRSGFFMDGTPLTIKSLVDGGDKPAENDENVLCFAPSSSSSSSSFAFKFLFRLRFGFRCILEWRVSSSERLNFLKHPGNEQLWGFSPVWVRI